MLATITSVEPLGVHSDRQRQRLRSRPPPDCAAYERGREFADVGDENEALRQAVRCVAPEVVRSNLMAPARKNRREKGGDHPASWSQMCC